MVPGCRARCEAVCRAWHAASLGTPQLWARVVWEQRYSTAEELLWLCQHGPVQQAKLHSVPLEALRVALGRWAPTLRQLDLEPRNPSPDLLTPVKYTPSGYHLNFLSSLQQLTYLKLSTWVPTAADARWMCCLQQLQVLFWHVSAPEDCEEALELPQLPPRLQHLRINGNVGEWRLLAQPTLLAGLQTLAWNLPSSQAALASLAGLSGLTGLWLNGWECVDRLLPSLAVCTGLRYLDLEWAQDWDSLGTPEGRAAVGRTLGLLPHLEALRLCDSGLASLPALKMGTPRPCACWTFLAIAALSLMRAGWPRWSNCGADGRRCMGAGGDVFATGLGSLAGAAGCQGMPVLARCECLLNLPCLACPQVPGTELCAAACRLTRVVLWEEYTEATHTEAATALAGLLALPALQVLHFEMDGVKLESTSNAFKFALALCKGQPGLDVRMDEWPDYYLFDHFHHLFLLRPRFR